MEDDLKKNGRRPKKKWKMTSKKKIKNWKTNQSTKINLIGCDTIVNSPSLV
jgi:predicted house-cleaning NTP pyrophosphatase (Maf/HAM1 superfamily)